jgi:hypothetical protein
MKNKLLILAVLLSFHCTWVSAVSAYPKGLSGLGSAILAAEI